MTITDIRTPHLGPSHDQWLAYIRVSLWREEKISPELQRGAIEQWAARTSRYIPADGWEEDLGVSGRHFNRRIMRLIERVEAGEARGIAVWRFSRFGRHNASVQINLARLEAAGGQLASATEDFDVTTAIGGLGRDVAFAFAAFESRRAGEQWKDTHAYRRDELHLPATGRHRFGYIWHPRRVPDPESPTGWRLQDERYAINPQWAEIVADAYDNKIDPAEAATFRAIGADWNAAGARTTRGSLWDGSSVRQYMDSGFPAGLLRVHDTDCTCGKYSTCRRYHYIPGAHDAIIEPDVWEAYRKHRADTRIRPPRARRPTYALTGLAVHGQCRHNLQANTGWVSGAHVPGYTYRCPYAAATTGAGCPGVYMTRAALEQQVYDWLLAEHLHSHAGIITVTAGPAPVDPRAHHARERARLEAELAKIATARGRLAADRAIDPDAITPEVYAAAIDRIADREATLREALGRATVAAATPTRADFGPLIGSIVDGWEAATAGERNAQLRTVLHRVVVHRVERAGARAGTRVEFHPLWDSDPWAVDPGAA